MFFGKLLPRDGNFFDMFNQHADRIMEAARAFSNMVANYNDVPLREKYNRDVDNAERAADRVTHEVSKALPLMASSKSPTRGHPKFPQAARSDYDGSALIAMRAAASLSL